MKKYIITISLLIAGLFNIEGQIDAGFTTVPLVNGKVVFDHFIITDQSLTTNQNYDVLQKWVKGKYSDSPLLSGIRFDDKARSVTVSSKAELLLPANSDGVREKMIMNYRFDATITNAGCMLVVRDITYQNAQKNGSSFFPKVYTAEQTITNQAVNTASEESELRNNIRKGTLVFLNSLYSEISGVF
ncbi:MAG: DUF4468 domain-containing protein [Fermentimonas sp.]|nr:DUF4468 domain-containing protein [Fermentimonas sp.]